MEIRQNKVILDGYVNVVERESRELPSPRGLFREIIVPKTFEKALRNAEDVELLFNHDETRKLGSINAGNLKLYEDNIGLRAIATVTDSEVIKKARNNELKGWSFGFVALQDSWEEGNDIQRRYVTEMDLKEVSILDVTPAYIATSVETRGESMAIVELRSDDKPFVHVEDIEGMEERNYILNQINTILED